MQHTSTTPSLSDRLDISSIPNAVNVVNTTTNAPNTANAVVKTSNQLNIFDVLTNGAHPVRQNGEAGYRFVVRSPQATALTLCLFDAADNESQYAMQRHGDNWHIWVAGVRCGQRYGFRAEGQTSCTQPFNHQKLLLDPYAKGVVGQPCLKTDDDLAYFCLDDSRDNAHRAPKSQIVDEHFDWGDDQAPRTPWSQTVIYELHVKGFSQRHPELSPAVAGTYAALAEPAIIGYLQDLGITAVELLPIAYGIDEPHLQRQGLSNYWNYNVLSPFAVDARYATGQTGSSPLSEFKSAVKALHAAGIEVILDVVFNHTAEAEQHHPTYSYRGLANADFYWLNDDGSCVNHTGCGNTLNASHPATAQWIVDCLSYWVEACHVDGFRFDLGAVLGREPNFNRHAALFEKIASTPALAGIKWIVEPWDIGAGGYQLGNFPSAFAEWNDRFRDDMRQFFVCQDGNLGAFATRLAGSSDCFQASGRPPHSSINLITAHDGFTLADLVRYNDKHNLANGEDNRDGHNNNYSDNHGVEGECNDEAIIAARSHTQRALLSALLLANGTPMLLAGDEMGHSQGGNNNAYCQDNADTWLDWQRVDADLFAFTRALIATRHRIASLHRDAWWRDSHITWLKPDASAMQTSDWHSQNDGCKAMQIVIDDVCLLQINGKRQAQTFQCPDGEWLDAQQRRIQGLITQQHLSITLYMRN